MRSARVPARVTRALLVGLGVLLTASSASAAVGVSVVGTPDCGYDAATNTLRPTVTLTRSDNPTDQRASAALRLFDSAAPAVQLAQLGTGVTDDGVQQNGAFPVPTNGERSFTPEGGAVFGDGGAGGAALSQNHDYLLTVRVVDFGSGEIAIFGPFTCRTAAGQADSDGDGLGDQDETNVYGTDPGNPDTDGDALNDGVEALGYDFGNDGTIDLDLPGIGVSPLHKDILVEVDHMGSDGTHSHAPDPAAIAAIVQSFANAPVLNGDGVSGIRLHVDYGTSAPSFGGGTWGSSSRATTIPHQANLGSSSGQAYGWSDFNAIEGANFEMIRRPFFHYALFAHDLAPGMGSTSGISREIPGSGFIVSLGGWTGAIGTAAEQAGTFMHELGHNLGLRHGGHNDEQFKPNYLSIMNYAFQTRGLIFDGNEGVFDYSRTALGPLDESNLNESVGLGVSRFGTRWFCAAGSLVVTASVTQVDWDCDGTIETSVAANINIGNPPNLDPDFDLLTGHNDWSAIVFNGGAVGDLGGTYVPPTQTTPPVELTEEVDALIPSLAKEPRLLIVDVVSALNALLPTGDDKADQKIRQALEHLERSLESGLFVDDSHLDPKSGGKAFNEAKEAVHKLLEIRNPTGGVTAGLEGLVDAFRTLAKTAIREATAGGGDAKKLAEAEQDMATAQEEVDEGRFDHAIGRYRRAWESALDARR